MAAISGVYGTVTYASGYTVLADQWGAVIDIVEQDITPLNPPGGHQILATAGLLRGGIGNYRCKLAVDNTATMVTTNPEEWTFAQMCEAREITPLGADWRTFVAGLLSTRISQTSYIDSIVALPVAASTGNRVLTVDTGRYYTVPIITSSLRYGVSVQDTERRIVEESLAAAAPTPTGGLPVAGTAGAATFVASGGRQVSGTILVTSVDCRVNRRESSGVINVGFVFNGVISGA